MKHFNYKIILLLLILLIISPKSVSANSIIIIDCPNEGPEQTTITCNLSGLSDKPISSLSAKINVSGDIEFVNFTTNPIWEGNGDNGILDLYTDTNKESTFQIGTITLKLTSKSSNQISTITINDIVYYDNLFKSIEVNEISKNIKINSKNNNLANLSIEGYDITPAFNKNITEYKATIDNDEIILNASVEDKNSTLEGTGTKKLTYGDNNFSIIVTSEAGTKKEYKVIITRPKEEIKEPQPEESENKEDKENENNVTTDDPPKEEPPKNSDSKLKTLNIDNYNIEFNSSIYKYSLEIPGNINELKIEAIPNNNKSAITIIGNTNLTFGNNKITITVTAEDGTKSEYLISVIKKSDICVVKNISISDYELEFNCNNYEYELEIGFEEHLNIDITTTDTLSKVNIYNNNNLKHNDIIKIVVNSGGIDYKYNIKILKNNFELDNLFTNKQLAFISIVLIITPIYIIGRKIYNKIKKNNSLID